MSNTTIDTLQLDIVVNSNKATSNLKQTTNEINKLNNSVQGTKKGGGLSNLGKSLNFGALVGKLYFVRNITKRLSDTLANVVQYGIDFTETLNLWQTAMRGNISEARNFVSEMNKAYGIAEQTLMKYQATFKNMLSAMGKISEDTAYGLSESLTQMAVDFASLYNVSIENAMTKFQAVLSGQVRPIRSISGYDITENTIFDLYKGLGGTKTMRQLDQTEKRLLRVYAVFTQMSGTGALGDLQKTLATNANQLRIMKEQAIEFATWIGNGISYLLQESGLLVKINALLIAAKEIAKSWAYSLGYVEEDWTGIYENINDVSGAIDEVQGKLLGFDKFQVLQDTGASEDTDVESIVAKALEAYQSLYKGVDNPAVKLANELLESLGFHLEEIVGSSGEIVKIWTGGGLDEIKSKILGIVAAVEALIATAIISKIILATTAIEAGTVAITAFKIATNVALFGGIFLVVYALRDLITNWDKMTTAMKVAKIAILAVGVALTTFSILSKIATANTTLLTTAFILQRIAAIGLAIGGIGLLVANITLLATAWDKMSTWEKVIGIFGAIGAAALAAAAAVAAFHGAWTLGTAAIAIVGGLAAIAAAFIGFKASMRDIGQFANGGVPDKGSLFIAGEAGAELVTSTSGGGSAVMNMEQLQTAITRGMLVAMASNETEQTQNININVGSQNWFNITRKVAQQNGYDLVKVR